MAHDNISSHKPAGARSSSARRGAVSLARQSMAGLRVLVALTVLLGVVYPLTVWGVGQVAFRWQAHGSLLTAEGERTTSRSDAVGSALVGQAFSGDEYFQPRPSAAGDGYDTLASAGSNLGPLNLDLVASIDERRAAVAAQDGTDPAAVPADALTASASGLDPHVSPEYAEQQVARVARARGLDEPAVLDLVAEHTQGRDLGFLGEPRVSVLELNLALGMMSS
jgi:K+-transporting ATPase ATPase C chain